MIDKIKAIPIADVLAKFGVETYRKWAGEYWIVQGNDKTSWRSFNENDNLINDFSWKGRASGSVIDVVMYFQQCDQKEAIKRLQSQFGIEQNQVQVNKFHKLQPLTETGKGYLESRWIDPGKVSEYVKRDNWIAVAVYKKSLISWVSIRHLVDDKSKRFRTTTGTDGDAVYQYLIDKNQNDLYVVEWMFDFLTLRQHTNNVIGMRSRSNGFDEVIRHKHNHNIILIPHNDEAWQKMRDKFSWIDHSVFELSEFGYNDLNDLYVDMQPWEQILTAIQDNAKPQSKIWKLFDELVGIQEKLKKDGMLWVSSPYPQVDKYTSWLIPWKVYTLWAPSNTGKSKLAYNYACHFLKQWKKVLFINLEVDPVFCLKEMVVCMEWQHQKKIDFKKIDHRLYQNLDIQNIFGLQEIDEEVKASEADIVFVDFIQNIVTKWGTAYEKMATVSKKLQQIAIESWKILFGLSQLSNATIKDIGKLNVDFVSMKWAWEITASSDVVFLLYDDWSEWQLCMKIIKNKFGQKWKEFVFNVDFGTWQFVLSHQVQTWF